MPALGWLLNLGFAGSPVTAPPVQAVEGDRLRIFLSGAESKSLIAVGTVPGVFPACAAGRCGPGVGTIRTTADGRHVQWMEPGATAFGPARWVNAQSTYLIRGQDPDKWLRADVYPDYLVAGQENSVHLADRWGNAVGHDDVTAAEATAGDVISYEITLHNSGKAKLSRLACWLDAATSGLEISDDGATWVSPTTEAAALALPDLAAGADDTLHLQRTIAASATHDPDVLNLIHFRYHAP